MCSCRSLYACTYLSAVIEFAFTAPSYGVTEADGAQAVVQVEIVGGELTVDIDVTIQTVTSVADTATGAACLHV